MKNVIVTRKLFQIGTKIGIANIQIGIPKKSTGIDWECPFYITNIGMKKEKYGRGIDGLQALINAIEGVRQHLCNSGIVFKWEGGEEDGNTGLSMNIPIFFGKRFTDKLTDIIESEINKHVIVLKEAKERIPGEFRGHHTHFP
jgi:hypothetical protein